MRSAKKGVEESQGGITRLTPLQYRILGVIAAAGNVPVTKPAIAHEVGCAVRTVDRAVKILREKGLVELAYNYSETGGQIGNTYRITSSIRSSCSPAGD